VRNRWDNVGPRSTAGPRRSSWRAWPDWSTGAYELGRVWLWVAGGRVVTKQARREACQPHQALAETPLPASSTAIGHTRGLPRWPDRRECAPHLGGEDGKLALIHQRHHRELPTAEVRPDRGWRPVPERDRHRGVVAHLLARSYDKVGDLTEAMRQVVGELTGAFTCWQSTAAQPGVVVGARATARWSWVSATVRPSLARTSRPFNRLHPRGARARPGPDRDDLDPRASIINFDGPGPGKGVPRQLGRRRSREGGFPDFMAKESTTSRKPCGYAPGPAG